MASQPPMNPARANLLDAIRAKGPKPPVDVPIAAGAAAGSGPLKTTCVQSSSTPPPVKAGPPDLMAAIRAKGQKPAVDTPAPTTAAPKVQAPKAPVAPIAPVAPKAPTPPKPAGPADLMAAIRARGGAGPGAAAGVAAAEKQTQVKPVKAGAPSPPPANDLQAQIRAQAEARQQRQQAQQQQQPPSAKAIPPKAQPTAEPVNRWKVPLKAKAATPPEKELSYKPLERIDSDVVVPPKLSMQKVHSKQPGEVLTSYRSGAISQINAAAKGAEPPPPATNATDELRKKLEKRQQTLTNSSFEKPPIVSPSSSQPKTMYNRQAPAADSRVVAAATTPAVIAPPPAVQPRAAKGGIFQRIGNRKNSAAAEPSHESPVTKHSASATRMMLPGFLAGGTHTPPPMDIPSTGLSLSCGRRKGSAETSGKPRNLESRVRYDPTGNYRLVTDPVEVAKVWNKLSCRVSKEAADT